MQKGQRKWFLLFILGIIVVAAFFSYRFWFNFPNLSLGDFVLVSSTLEEEVSEVETGRLVFLGDIMLARAVERTGRAYGGADYHFAIMDELTRQNDVVIANFESAVPTPHVPTANYTFRFSSPTNSLEALRQAGISAVSLANNHALDHGPVGYRQTIEKFENIGVTPFGHPTLLDNNSILLTKVGGASFAIVAAHTLFTKHSDETWQTVIDSAAAKADYVAVYIHWGEEYVLTHNLSERQLAEKLAGLGVDFIIGHHPHVVQDIAMIGEVPVVYSLGNFIFDQYFSIDVQQGLVVALRVEDGQVLGLELIPVSSIGSNTRPQLMVGAIKDNFLQALADRSDESLRDGIASGFLDLSLASSD